jgi:hypothetical protein
VHHRVPFEAAHGLSSASAAYDQPWCPYPSSSDLHYTEQQRASNVPPPPVPPSGQLVKTNRQLPQLPPNGPCGQPNTLPALGLNTIGSHPPTSRPVNGVLHNSHIHLTPTYPAPPPHSATPDFRPQMTYSPQEPSSNGDAPPPPPPAPHTMPPAQFPTPVPHISHTPAPYDPSYYQNQAFGMRQRKAARAQQVMTVLFPWRRKQDCAGYKGNRLTLRYSIKLIGLRPV